MYYCILKIPKKGTLHEDPDQMLHYAAFYQALIYLRTEVNIQS